MSQRVVVCFMVGFIPVLGTASAGIAAEVVDMSEHDEERVSDIIEEIEIITRCSQTLTLVSSDDDEQDEEVQRLLDMHRSPVVSRRVKAAYELFDWGVESGADVEAVRSLLEKEDEPWVRRYLVLTLLDLDDETIIVDLLGQDDPETRSVVAQYIFDSFSVGIGLESLLIETYRKDDPWWVRVPFLGAFSEGVHDESLHLLQDALSDPLRDVRGAAVIALEARGDPRSLDDLLDVLGDSSLIGEDSPVAGIADLSDESVIPWIEEAALSESPVVREEAATALGRLCARGSEEILVRMLEDRFYGVARSAAAALKTLEPDEDCSAALSGDRLTWTAILAPEARIVAPSQGHEAEAWEVAPGDRNGGTRHEIGAGTTAQVVSGAHYRDETWLEVDIATPDFDTVWMRERELRRLNPEEALEIVNGTNGLLNMDGKRRKR